MHQTQSPATAPAGHMPGRKTDVKDAAWIVDLLRHGLLRGSFIPPLPQHDLRDLTRQRTNLVQKRAEIATRLQKVLEWANLKLTSVLSDITSVSARAMLEAIIAGEDTVLLADLVKGRMRTKRAAMEQASTGRVRLHHRFLLAQHLTHLDFLEEQIEAFTQQSASSIHAQAASSNGPRQPAVEASGSEAAQLAAEERVSERPVDWEAAVELFITIPGVRRQTAELIIAAIGTDTCRFRSAAHLGSWSNVRQPAGAC